MKQAIVGMVFCLLPLTATAQSSTPGCHDGRLTDARAYFYSLIHRNPGDSASDYIGVLAQSGLEQGPGVGVRASDTHFGITQQIAAEGPRGVLFLPTDIPDENGYYTRQVLVISDTTTWTWIERFPNRPPYAPRACRSQTNPVPLPPPTPPADDNVQLARIEMKVDAIAASLEEHRKVSRSFVDHALGFFKDPRTIMTIIGIVGGLVIPGGK